MTTGPGYHQQIILAIDLYHTGAFEQSSLIHIFFLEKLVMGTFHDMFQILCQLHHFSCSVENVWCAISVEKERGIMKMRKTTNERPGAGSLQSRHDIGFATGVVVRSKEGIELAIVIFQRCGPLTATIDGTILHVIFR